MLLILAVVAIRAVTGDGIIAHAKNARDQYQQKAAQENALLSNLTDYLTEQTGGSSSVDHITEDGVPIPKGFTQVEGTSKATGLVITDNNPNGASEFVWIPVPTLNEFARPTSGTDANGRTNYQGVLYNFEGTTATEMTDYGQGTNSYAEPENIEDYYDNTDNLPTWTETLYQEEFNKMVESVAKYKGFYVGRYETSLNGTIVQSKVGESPIENQNFNWYEMYENSRTYAPESSTKSVVSEMIWGCQWDAMLRFVLTTSDASHVTANNNVGHIYSEFTSAPYQTGGTNYSTVYKGTTAYNDKAANIYDLEGNVSEWTQEAAGDNYRCARGGGLERL